MALAASWHGKSHVAKAASRASHRSPYCEQQWEQNHIPSLGKDKKYLQGKNKSRTLKQGVFIRAVIKSFIFLGAGLSPFIALFFFFPFSLSNANPIHF